MAGGETQESRNWYRAEAAVYEVFTTYSVYKVSPVYSCWGKSELTYYEACWCFGEWHYRQITFEATLEGLLRESEK